MSSSPPGGTWSRDLWIVMKFHNFDSRNEWRVYLASALNALVGMFGFESDAGRRESLLVPVNVAVVQTGGGRFATGRVRNGPGRDRTAHRRDGGRWIVGQQVAVGSVGRRRQRRQRVATDGSASFRFFCQKGVNQTTEYCHLFIDNDSFRPES